jgi:hypothetical protein
VPGTGEQVVAQQCYDTRTPQRQPQATTATEQRYTIAYTAANVAFTSIKWIPTVTFYCMLILFYFYVNGTVKLHLELN